MKQFLFTILALTGLLIYSGTGHSQNLFSQETFPNTFNTGGTLGTDGTFTGSLGSWSTVTGANFSMEVDNNAAQAEPSAPNAFRVAVNNAAASTVITDNILTSPVVSLNFGACTPSSVNFQFQLFAADADNGNTNATFGVQFFNSNTSTWSTVWSQTSDWIFDNNFEDGWAQVSVSVNPSFWTAGFRYRFFMTKNATTGGSNSTDLWIDDMGFDAVTTGPAFPDFSDATPTRIVDGGAAGGGVEVNDVYRFDNVITTPDNIYAEVKIEAIVNAVVTNIDNNGAGTAQRFQPLIDADVTSLTADREGYVQFAITFKKTSDNSLVFLNGIRYRHFDVDGTTGTGYSFRETGWITGHASFLVNVPSDLTDGGNVVSGGFTWKKALGELVEHDGLTNDPDVYFTATYGAINTVRFRLGYIFDQTSGTPSFNPNPREYGTEFGCFDVSNQGTLPVKLLSFSGTYKNQATLLNWETENQQNFDHFEIQRSVVGGSDYATIAVKQSQGVGTARQSYQYTDNLSSVSGNIFLYRLKMVDADGEYKYSNVVMIRKDQKSINGLSIAPNPVFNGSANVRLTAATSGTVEFKVIDMAGRVVLRQQEKIFEGNNSISLNNLNHLQPGVYTLQMIDGDAMVTSKFSIVK